MNLPTAPTSSGPAERTQLVIDSIPAQLARTQRFTLGVPRSFQISPDGSRVVFLRSRGGADPPGSAISEPEGRGAAWGEERRRRRGKAVPVKGEWGGGRGRAGEQEAQ